VNEMVPILMLVGLFILVYALEDVKRAYTMIKGIHNHFVENKQRLEAGDPDAKEGLGAVYDYIGIKPKQEEKEDE